MRVGCSNGTLGCRAPGSVRVGQLIAKEEEEEEEEGVRDFGEILVFQRWERVPRNEEAGLRLNLEQKRFK